MPRVDRAAFGSWAEYYRHYQAALARRFLIPFLAEHGVTIAGKDVLDIGCGNGGCTAAFAEAGARCLGIDIGDFPWEPGPDLQFRKGDILDPSVAESVSGRFDVVVLRDVIEHIDDKATLLRHVARAVRGKGSALVTFPPYWSAFGAHQQVEFRGSPLRAVPYLHWHPRLRGVARARMTIGGFEDLVRRSRLTVRARKLYISRPSFELRYGVPAVPFPFPRLAGVREVVCSGASYLLECPEPRAQSRSDALTGSGTTA